MKISVYALYRGDDFISVGTFDEMAKELGMKAESLRCYRCPSREENYSYEHSLHVYYVCSEVVLSDREDKKIPHTFGGSIKRYRLSHGYTTKAFTKLIDSTLSESLLLNWEAGRAVPHGERLQKLDKLIGVTPEDFMAVAS